MNPEGKYILDSKNTVVVVYGFPPREFTDALQRFSIEPRITVTEPSVWIEARRRHSGKPPIESGPGGSPAFLDT
jgi:hypothetical protein